MGLDIYAGTLTRYYSHNWKTITQQLSEENGQHYKQVDENGNEIKPVDDISEIEQIREVICQWSDDLASNIDTSLQTPLWDEKGKASTLRISRTGRHSALWSCCRLAGC